MKLLSALLFIVTSLSYSQNLKFESKPNSFEVKDGRRTIFNFSPDVDIEVSKTKELIIRLKNFQYMIVPGDKDSITSDLMNEDNLTIMFAGLDQIIENNQKTVFELGNDKNLNRQVFKFKLKDQVLTSSLSFPTPKVIFSVTGWPTLYDDWHAYIPKTSINNAFDEYFRKNVNPIADNSSKKNNQKKRVTTTKTKPKPSKPTTTTTTKPVEKKKVITAEQVKAMAKIMAQNYHSLHLNNIKNELAYDQGLRADVSLDWQDENNIKNEISSTLIKKESAIQNEGKSIANSKAKAAARSEMQIEESKLKRNDRYSIPSQKLCYTIDIPNLPASAQNVHNILINIKEPFSSDQIHRVYANVDSALVKVDKNPSTYSKDVVNKYTDLNDESLHLFEKIFKESLAQRIRGTSINNKYSNQFYKKGKQFNITKKMNANFKRSIEDKLYLEIKDAAEDAYCTQFQSEYSRLSQVKNRPILDAYSIKSSFNINKQEATISLNLKNSGHKPFKGMIKVNIYNSDGTQKIASAVMNEDVPAVNTISTTAKVSIDNITPYFSQFGKNNFKISFSTSRQDEIGSGQLEVSIDLTQFKSNLLVGLYSSRNGIQTFKKLKNAILNQIAHHWYTEAEKWRSYSHNSYKVETVDNSSPLIVILHKLAVTDGKEVVKEVLIEFFKSEETYNFEDAYHDIDWNRYSLLHMFDYNDARTFLKLYNEIIEEDK